MRYSCLPKGWNNGTVEQWNNGFLKEIIDFEYYREIDFAESSILRFIKAHSSNIPLCHYSNWDIARIEHFRY